MRKQQRIENALNRLESILSDIDAAKNMMEDYENGQGGFADEEEFQQAMDEAHSLHQLAAANLIDWASAFYEMMRLNDRNSFARP